MAPRDSKMLAWLERAIKTGHNGETTRNESLRSELSSSQEQMQKRLERMYEDKLDGKISSDFYDKKSDEYKKKLEEITLSLAKLGDDDLKYYEAGYAAHELAEHAMEIYQSEEATIDDKRLLLSNIFSNLGLKAHKINATYTYGFEFIAKWTPEINRFSNLEVMASNKDKTHVLHASALKSSAARTRTWNHLLTLYPMFSHRCGLYHRHLRRGAFPCLWRKAVDGTPEG